LRDDAWLSGGNPTLACAGHRVYGFLTSAPNAVVEPIHSKGHAGDLKIVARGVDKEDKASGVARRIGSL
jgi:hypothetical protein